ncbi:ABC transporter permease [Belliella sp. DSM 111904]|uniref:ABC transporter permease n=1 Tax=Belliella filtrata TaxID=2923435 RepID=A0ABS9V4X5_9BACT|nr:ABC transporter permease [Belliella filtrata]MCH7411456.1 ABC transporter permease [Belliella filtrata]
MFTNYVKIAWRNLWRNKEFSFINIIGLTLGIGGAVLILLWIQYERSFDQFHEKKEQLFEVWNQADFNGEISSWGWTPKPLGPVLGADQAEVAAFSRYQTPYDMLLKYQVKGINQQTVVIDPEFFSMFDFPLIMGEKDQVFAKPESLVLTESAVKRLFGDENPIGKEVVLENQTSLIVTGVLADFPSNTKFQFDAAIPWALYKQLGFEDEFWGNNSVITYIELHPEVKVETAAANIRDVTQKHSSEQVSLILHPLTKAHLYDHYDNGVLAEGKIKMIRLFFWIAILIILIACINFMNLSTARSEKRAKEIGIRKISGAGRGRLILQFIGESMVTTVIASFLALLIVSLLIPHFNNLMGTSIYLPFGEPIFWIIYIPFVILIGIIAGSYPALFLSSLVPARILKGKVSSPKSAFSLRKVLVVMQFTFAAILIAATLVVKSQIDFAQSRNAGYDRDQLIYLMMSDQLRDKYEPFRAEVLSSGAATSLTRTMSPISETWSNTWGMSWEGKDPDVTITIDRYSTDADLSKTLGLNIIEGRDIDIYKYATDSNAVLLNEAALKLMDFENPLGQLIKDNNKEWKVVGIVEDFVVNSPFHQVKPLVIFGPKAWFNVFHLKLSPSNSVAENLAKVEQIFDKYSADFPFDYTFVDQDYANKFQSEQRVSALTLWFSGLAIFISCLGLFGLAAFMAEQRLKEISIRKVLGASSANLIVLLTSDFIKLVAISLLIGIPIAWYVMNIWLENFNYRIELGVGIFGLVALITLLIALLTVSSQALKAAWSNPIKALKGD